MGKKALIVLATGLVLPPLSLALGQPSLFFLTLGIDIGAVSMFAYISYTLYKAMNALGNIAKSAEAGIKAMEKAGITIDNQEETTQL